MQKLFYYLCLTLAMVSVSVSISSCYSDTPTDNHITENNTSAAHKFATSFSLYFNDFLNHPIKANRSRGFSGKGDHIGIYDTIPIYVELTPNFDTTLVHLINEVHTPKQLLEFAKRTGAQYTLENYGTHDVIIYVDETECTAALTPMIEVCKNYLKDKGFTDTEIQEVLVESGAHEHDLISFVIAVSGIEGLREEDPFSLNLNPDLFSAAGDNQFESQTLERALWCLGEVVGISTLQNLSGKVLTKAALKIAIKTTLRTFSGAVGAMLALAELSACYYN